VVSLPAGGAAVRDAASAKPQAATGEPDFKRMTAAEKIAYHKARWDRILG
jgi:hypothetical protein